MRATINGRSYRVEFSYRTRGGKRNGLARNSPIAGVSACAIIGEERRVVSVAAAVCSHGDVYSRRSGREQAFSRAVHDCGILLPEVLSFAAWFQDRFPDPAPPVPRRSAALTPARKQELLREGYPKREERAVRSIGCTTCGAAAGSPCWGVMGTCSQRVTAFVAEREARAGNG